jgi:2-polyprenyl-6-methoxyphenol hydroxylase-like FAD-dependent oxidoreductase
MQPFLKNWTFQRPQPRQLVSPVLKEQETSNRVAIIGAGPGGLASALFLAKQGVPTTVYEKLNFEEYSLPRGAAFTLSLSTQRLIASIDARLAQRLLKYALPALNSHIHYAGWQFDALSPPALNFISWFRFVMTLYEATREHSDLIKFSFAKKLIDIKSNLGDEKELIFATGESENDRLSRIHTSCVIGTDGHRSAAFKSLNPSYQLPFSGKVYYRALSSLPPESAVLQEFRYKGQDIGSQVNFVVNKGFVFIAYLADPMDSTKIQWTLSQMEPEFSEASEQELLLKLGVILRDANAPQLAQTILKRTIPGSLLRHPFYKGDDQPHHLNYKVQWKKIFLVGDATGPARPIGYGLQQTLESAFLSTSIVAKEWKEGVFEPQSYEEYYKNRMVPIKKFSNSDFLQSAWMLNRSSLDLMVQFGLLEPISTFLDNKTARYAEGFVTELSEDLSK